MEGPRGIPPRFPAGLQALSSGGSGALLPRLSSPLLHSSRNTYRQADSS